MAKVKIGTRLDTYTVADREVRQDNGALKTVDEIEVGLRALSHSRPAGRVDGSWHYRLPAEYRK